MEVWCSKTELPKIEITNIEGYQYRGIPVGYLNLTPDPQGAQGTSGVKIQVSSNQKTSLTKVVRRDKGIASAPPKELEHTHKAGVS